MKIYFAAVAIIAALTGTAEGVHIATSPASAYDTVDSSSPIENMMTQVESESLAEGMVESEAGAEVELRGRGKRQRKSNWRSSGHTSM